MFSGGLGSKRKADLQEIASALKLSTDGTKDDVQARIKKHLDDNQHKLEENPKFAGLYGKRRKASVQPQDVPLPTSVGLSNSVDSEEESPPQPSPATRTTSQRSSIVLAPVEEVASVRGSPVRRSPTAPKTPGTELRNISTMLKRGGEMDSRLSPSARRRISGRFVADEDEEEEQDDDEDDEAENEDPALLQKASPRGKIPAMVAAPKELAIAAEKRVVREGWNVLETTSVFLSNARNIWTTAVVLEFITLLSQTMTFRWAPISSSTVHCPYPSLTETNPAIFKILFHWALPTIILPLLLGNLISFSPPYPLSQSPRSSTTTTNRILGTPLRLYRTVDPLSLSIVRLFAHYAYPYASFDVMIPGKVLTAAVAESEGPAHEVLLAQTMDVLGREWRLWSAGMGMAFAFAEALGARHQSQSVRPGPVVLELESEMEEVLEIERA